MGLQHLRFTDLTRVRREEEEAVEAGDGVGADQGGNKLHHNSPIFLNLDFEFRLRNVLGVDVYEFRKA